MKMQVTAMPTGRLLQWFAFSIDHNLVLYLLSFNEAELICIVACTGSAFMGLKIAESNLFEKGTRV